MKSSLYKTRNQSRRRGHQLFGTHRNVDYNSMFGYCVDRIYHIELEIKEYTDTSMSASYLEKSLKIPKW
jgi:hypothetical protein